MLIISQSNRYAFISKTETVRTAQDDFTHCHETTNTDSSQLNKYLKLDQKGQVIAEYVWIDSTGETRSKSRVSCFHDTSATIATNATVAVPDLSRMQQLALVRLCHASSRVGALVFCRVDGGLA